MSSGAEIRCQAGLCHRTGLNIRPVAMNVVDHVCFFFFFLRKLIVTCKTWLGEKECDTPRQSRFSTKKITH